MSILNISFHIYPVFFFFASYPLKLYFLISPMTCFNHKDPFTCLPFSLHSTLLRSVLLSVKDKPMEDKKHSVIIHFNGYNKIIYKMLWNPREENHFTYYRKRKLHKQDSISTLNRMQRRQLKLKTRKQHMWRQGGQAVS